MILINDTPLEQFVSGVNVSENYCSSCSYLTGTDAYCRMVKYKGTKYEEMPETIIRSALYKAAGINKKGEHL